PTDMSYSQNNVFTKAELQEIETHNKCGLPKFPDLLEYLMTFAKEYETGSLRKNHSEQWYNMHLWCAIVDRCFSDVDNMDPIRGESCSIASDLEFGGREAGKTYKTDKGTEWLVESGLKLLKTLKDMFVQLGHEVEWSTTILCSLTTGYMCRFSRVKSIESLIPIPHTSLPLIVATWRAK
ncbi:2046_t:CDS:2, partial [Dentiscutata heterogama]